MLFLPDPTEKCAAAKRGRHRKTVFIINRDVKNVKCSARLRELLCKPLKKVSFLHGFSSKKVNGVLLHMAQVLPAVLGDFGADSLKGFCKSG